jgi:hypothetical protein
MAVGECFITLNLLIFKQTFTVLSHSLNTSQVALPHIFTQTTVKQQVAAFYGHFTDIAKPVQCRLKGWKIHLFCFWPGQDIYLFSETSRPALMSTQYTHRVASLPRGKTAEACRSPLPTISTKVKNAWSYNTTFPCAFTACTGTNLNTAYVIMWRDYKT